MSKSNDIMPDNAAGESDKLDNAAAADAADVADAADAAGTAEREPRDPHESSEPSADSPPDPLAAEPSPVAPDILFISGSPRQKTCVSLINLLEQGAKKAGAKTQNFLLSKKHINPCVGCGSCEKTGNCAFANKTVKGRFADDYLELKAVLERVDAVAIVSPVYYSGPPAQLKALFDRMQPYWAQRYVLGKPAAPKRPAQLFVVGSGSDAHGYTPLSGITKSAMAVAGFDLEKVNSFIGYQFPKDMPRLPSAEEAAELNYAQAAMIKRKIALQQDFEERAVAAGGAFARFVVKKKQEAIKNFKLGLGAAVDSGASSGKTKREPSPLDVKDELRADIDRRFSELISHTPRKDVTDGADVVGVVDVVDSVDAAGASGASGAAGSPDASGAAGVSDAGEPNAK